ncbi:MAG TPA: hypothetical protein VFY49_06110, partial [Myxococcota bacterium]|nr:hypothetical protein [Myxococcota bacterium]
MARSTRFLAQLTRRAAPLVALCAALLPSFPGEADDTLLFTSRVPPNVLLMIDNSNSMNELMRHPASVSQPPPGWPYAGCDILPDTGPACGGSCTTGYGPYSVTDSGSTPRATRYDCFPGFGCWFVIDNNTSGFTTTTTSSDDAQQGYITRTFCGHTRKIWHDGQQTDINGVSGNDNPTWIGGDYLEWLFNLDDGTTYTWGTP